MEKRDNNCIKTTSDNLDFRQLYADLDAYLWNKYPDGNQDYWQNNIIEYNPNVLVYYIENKAVACGCFKKYNEKTAELKRMFVRPEARGKGIALEILNELEAWAKSQNFDFLILETLYKQDAAIQLYQKAGFEITENYEPYVGNEHSVCMKKAIV